MLKMRDVLYVIKDEEAMVTSVYCVFSWNFVTLLSA